MLTTTHHHSVIFYYYFFPPQLSYLSRCFALFGYNSIIPKSQPFFIKTHRKQLREGWAKFNQQPANAIILAEERRMLWEGATADAPVPSTKPQQRTTFLLQSDTKGKKSPMLHLRLKQCIIPDQISAQKRYFFQFTALM